MKFKINNIDYIIIEKTKEEMFGAVKEPNKEDGKDYLGLHFSAKNEIWLLNTLKKQQKRRTLLHELMHAYVWCYLNNIKQIDEEDLCDISANSHDIINRISKEFFNKK